MFSAGILIGRYKSNKGELLHLKIFAVISGGSSTVGNTLHPAAARASPFPARSPGVSEVAQAGYNSSNI